MAVRSLMKGRRSGTVLVIVLLILFVLTLLAAALTLITRVERRTSEIYTADEAARHVIESIEIWSISDVLLKDRYFGSEDGFFRFYDPAGILRLTGNHLKAEPVAELKKTTLLQPSDYIEQALDGDGWIEAEELFGSNYELILREERYERGRSTKARFLLHMEDIGGARLDVNLAGNLITNEEGEDALHRELHGQTPLETRLSYFLEHTGIGNPVETTGNLVDSRGYGNLLQHLEFPGGAPPYPDYPVQPSEEEPDGGMYPFGAGDLYDCIMACLYLEFDNPPERLSDYVNGKFGSRLSGYIGGNLQTARHLTTASASGIFSDFASDASALFDGADRMLKWIAPEDLPFSYEGYMPFTGEERDLVLQRPLRWMLNEFRDDPETGVLALANLLDYLAGAETGMRIPWGTGTDLIARNIWNMMVWIHEEDGLEYVRGGVVPGVPYVAEVVAHRPTYVILPPNPDADRPKTDDLDKMKYIKMVNPWPPGIPSKAVKLLIDGKVIKTFEEGEIRPRGHFLLVPDSLAHGSFFPFDMAVVRDLTKLSYGDPIEIQAADTGTVLWEGDAGGNLSFPDYWIGAISTQIRDPRSRYPHSWTYGQPTPNLIPPVWQGIPIPVKGGVIWIWLWNWYISGWYWPSGNTGSIAWFNSSWKGSSADISAGGDGWRLLHPANMSDPGRNLLGSFSLPLDSDTGERFLRSPADLTYVHSGLDWSTISPFDSTDFAEQTGAGTAALLDGISRYLTGNSPYESDPDGAPVYCPESEEYLRLGPPLRVHGRVNVNTAPAEVLRALIPLNVLLDEDKWNLEIGRFQFESIVSDISGAVKAERESERGAFVNLDDFFDRVPEIFGLKPEGWSTGEIDLLNGMPNSPQRHALARSLYNRITVRSDVWGVTGRVQLYENVEDEIDIVAERAFYLIIDRSFPDPRVLLRAELPLQH